MSGYRNVLEKSKKTKKQQQSILSNISAHLSWRKFLRIPFWDLVMDPGLFSWHYGKADKLWLNLKAAGPMMMMPSDYQPKLNVWYIETFIKGFKNTYQTILDVGYSAWSGMVLTIYSTGNSMLCCLQYQTFFCCTGSTVLFSVLLDKCRFTACCMDVDTLGLSCARAWTHWVSFHFKHWM